MELELEQKKRLEADVAAKKGEMYHESCAYTGGGECRVRKRRGGPGRGKLRPLGAMLGEILVSKCGQEEGDKAGFNNNKLG